MKKTCCLLTVLTILLIQISCKSTREEVESYEDIYDSEIEADSYFIDSVLAAEAMGEAFVDSPEEKLVPEYESVVGVWVCDAGRALEFKANGEFHLIDSYQEPGEWYIENNKLVISLVDDTVIFWINQITTQRMIIDSVQFGEWQELLCETGSNYMIYNMLYKDVTIEEPVSADLIGTWYGGDGYDIHEDWSFDYIGPDCFGGKWEFRDMTLYLYDDECGTTEMNIKQLSKYRLQMETASYFRLPEEGAYIRTSKSE